MQRIVQHPKAKSSWWFPVSIFLLGLAGWRIPVPVFAQEAEELFRPAEFVKTIDPRFPLAISTVGISKGFAVVYFMVNPDGTNRDFVTFAASHTAFAESTISALKRWQITPSYVGGKPIASRCMVKAKFISEGNISTFTAMDAVTKLQRQMGAPNHDYYAVSDVDELDEVPLVVKREVPDFPKFLADEQPAGQVLIEFFIDTGGNVKAPGVKSATHILFALSALEAIEKWQFQPCLREGKPVVVRAYQPFIFNIPIETVLSGEG